MTRRLVILIAAFSICSGACTQRSPTAPTRASDEHASQPSSAPSSGQPIDSSATTAAQAVPGIYELSFVDTSLQPVTTLVVGTQELELAAHVTNGSGAPAQGGAVRFQYCSYKGLPPYDITRADEAPLAACESGEAIWKNLVTVPVNASGYAYMDFGIVQIPRTVGFRFIYVSQGSGIANGTSLPEDFTWVAS
jgi:hypothetical protein